MKLALEKYSQGGNFAEVEYTTLLPAQPGIEAELQSGSGGYKKEQQLRRIQHNRIDKINREDKEFETDSEGIGDDTPYEQDMSKLEVIGKKRVR
ncbi:hypothetical protein FQA39_LY03892 [Lamprigera yunnana]|nr:hypothetical protein FQA39_LY03892 [Lamprigera yunnana]